MATKNRFAILKYMRKYDKVKRINDSFFSRAVEIN